MSFYGDWQQNRNDGLQDEAFVQQFIDCSDSALGPLLDGEEADVVEAIKVILSVPMDDFINGINHKYSFTSKDVMQYSNLSDATSSLCTILSYEEFALSFEEAGARLTHATQQFARIKYGENHAKVAAALSLVKITRDKERQRNMVRISSLGSIITLLDESEKEEIIKRMAIRNPFIKTLIYKAKCGRVSYSECVSAALKGQTIIRRRNNNRILVNMILSDSTLKDNIRWL